MIVVKTPAQLNETLTAGGFYMEITLHTPPITTQELYSRFEEIAKHCKLTQS